MKTILLLSTLGFVIAFTGCSDSRATARDEGIPPAAHYKPGYGVQLSPSAEKFAAIKTVEFSKHLPAAAVLRTVKGDFVYVENDGWFLRTAVTLGSSTPENTEVGSGLYEGDRVVVSGVRHLWLAELHAINGGIGCADGH